MRKLLVLAAVLILSGCAHGKNTYAGYFYVDRDGNQYQCVINDVHVTRDFDKVSDAAKACDELNKVLAPYADVPGKNYTGVPDNSPGVAVPTI